MASSSDAPALPWWHRRLPSFLVFVVVLMVVAGATAFVGRDVVKVLPEVPKDQLGQDLWTDPIGLESFSGLAVAHIPDCAAGAVTRIALWDANSKPYWEVTGVPTPLTTFVLGAPPKGFVVVTPYRKPPPRAVLRLVVFRKVGGVAGIRYQQADLRKSRVVSGNPLARYTVSGFQTAAVCSDSKPTKVTVPG